MSENKRNWPVTVGLAIALGLATLVILKNSLRMESDRETFKVKNDLKAIKASIELYKQHYGFYPKQQKNYILNFAEQFSKTPVSPDNKGPREMFINFDTYHTQMSNSNYAAPNADPTTLIDVWGEPYLYITNGKEFTIWSTGNDKVNSNTGGDDISIAAVDKQAILDKRKTKASQ
ncbi:MAG: type II secretion system protein GspG [Lentisphaeraceae bacterium]|nr:type II secretion system protein GspG [Lentisphaeraceae bacterium]